MRTTTTVTTLLLIFLKPSLARLGQTNNPRTLFNINDLAGAFKPIGPGAPDDSSANNNPDIATAFIPVSESSSLTQSLSAAPPPPPTPPPPPPSASTKTAGLEDGALAEDAAAMILSAEEAPTVTDAPAVPTLVRDRTRDSNNFYIGKYPDLAGAFTPINGASSLRPAAEVESPPTISAGPKNGLDETLDKGSNASSSSSSSSPPAPPTSNKVNKTREWFAGKYPNIASPFVRINNNEN